MALTTDASEAEDRKKIRAAALDYMHLVKVDSEWKIINVLWELTPERWAERGGKER